MADQDTRLTDGDGLHVIRVPNQAGILSPILHTIRCSFSLSRRARQGHRCRQARNLAKSVTVE